MCNLLKDIAEVFSNIDTILKTILTGSSVFILIWGCFKLSDLIKSYREKYLSANFGFYAKLESLSLQLNEALVKLCSASDSGYIKSQKIEGETEKYCNNVRIISNGLLSLFSTENNQVVPLQIFDEWKEKTKNLNRLLNECLYIEIVDMSRRTTFTGEVKACLKYFTEKIPDNQKSVLKRIK